MDRKLPAQLVVLAFAGTLINTMPIWLAELKVKSHASTEFVGLVASLSLISTAMGCLLHKHWLPAKLAGAVIVAVLFAGSYFGEFSAWLVLPATLLFGLSVGSLTAEVLIGLREEGNLHQMFGVGMALGCVLAFVSLYLASDLGFKLLPLLLFVSVIQASILLFAGNNQTSSFDFGHSREFFRQWRFIPFFVAMGAYWTYLELFAQTLGIETISGWLAASLIISAFGSFLVSILPGRIHRVVLGTTLVVTALSAAFTYLAESELVVGLMILINAFGLFAFIPLFISNPYRGGERPDAVNSMARYLFGFAFGGIAGGAVVSFFDYTGLAWFMLATGVVALPEVFRIRTLSD